MGTPQDRSAWRFPFERLVLVFANLVVILAGHFLFPFGNHVEVAAASIGAGTLAPVITGLRLVAWGARSAGFITLLIRIWSGHAADCSKPGTREAGVEYGSLLAFNEDHTLQAGGD
jgi:hypothetical protein